MINGKYYAGDDPHAGDAMKVRMKVFVEEQGCPAAEEKDEFDPVSTYAVVYNEKDEPVGTGRLYIDAEEHFHIGRVAVLKEYRGQKTGDFIMKMLLELALDLGAPEIHLSSREDAVGFYRRYGFQCSGEPYSEVGIPHRHMFVLRRGIDFDGTGAAECTGNCSECNAHAH